MDKVSSLELLARPAVSVIVPAYNTADFIAETLDSIFQQTFKNFEVVVVNDGSPDSEKLEHVLERYWHRIVYLKQANRGLAGARNTAIRQARGEYLAFLDSDDTWMSKYLEKQIEFLRQTPGLDAVYCDSQHFGDLRFSGQTFMQLYPSNGPVTFEALISDRCQVCISCTVVRYEAVIDAGLFDEQLKSVEDFDLWLRMLHRGGTMAYHRTVLGRRRLRPGSLSSASVTMLASQAQVLRKLDNTLDFTPPVRALIHEKLQLIEALVELERAKLFLARDQLREAEDCLQKANTFFQQTKLELVLLALRTLPNATRLWIKFWYFGLNCIALCRAALRRALGLKDSDPT